MRHPMVGLLEAEPVVPTIKDASVITQSCANPLVFLLCGDIMNISELISQVHSLEKKAVVHADLITGLAPKEIAADYLEKAGADGIISTKPFILKRASELGLMTVLRVFAIDSKSVSNLKRELNMFAPDLVEILPGTMPKVIEQLSKEIRTPLVAGGMISDKSDIVAALNAGAIAVSTSNPALWES